LPKAAAIAVLSLTLASAASAAQSTQMAVSVEVIARTILTVDRQPATVIVTESDIARGYVDVPAAIGFEVRSNARNGFLLRFQPVSGPFSKATLTWDDALVTVGADASWIARPYRSGISSGIVDVRLTLASGIAAGTYPWPVALSAE
jgi:hypothetical protein